MNKPKFKYNFNLLRELSLRDHLKKILNSIDYNILSQSDKDHADKANHLLNSITEKEIYKNHLK